MTRYLSAQDAADALGISLATLYSYVSRGLIRSVTADNSKRTRRYSAEDVEALQQRQTARHEPDRRAEGALHWGVPLTESALTLIDNGRVYYRGRDALALAQSATVEQVAGLLWLNDMTAGPALFEAIPHPTLALPDLAGLGVIARLQATLAHASAADWQSHDLRPEAVAACGARLLAAMTTQLTGAWRGGVVESLAAALAPDAAPLLRTALILCADHEFNVSSFTARCVASAHATPYAVVIAGLSALSGHRHGGYTARVAAFLREVSEPARAVVAVRERLQRGEELPGFGHRLYPNGDPRARLLLAVTRAAYPDAPMVQLAQAVIEAVGEHPTIDMGLVMLSGALGLAAETALALFALGRTLGWIGHAIEGYADDLIRPRARYVGEAIE